MPKLRTSAGISEETLLCLFGVKFAGLYCPIEAIDVLESYVDEYYTKQQIVDLVLNPAI